MAAAPPVPVVAPATPGECFQYAIEAWRLALKYMTPVMYLSDAFVGNGAEPSTLDPQIIKGEDYRKFLRDNEQATKKLMNW